MGRATTDGDADASTRNSNDDPTSVVAITQCRNNEQINDAATNGPSVVTIAANSTAVDDVQPANDVSAATPELLSAINYTKSYEFPRHDIESNAFLKHESNHNAVPRRVVITNFYATNAFPNTGDLSSLGTDLPTVNPCNCNPS